MKYAVVTGSTRGIGFSIASKLIKEGYFVFINGRNECTLNLPKEQYQFIEADTSTMEGVESIVGDILKKTDTIDCIVLNAGTTCRKSVLDITYDEWQKVMDTNVNMPFFLVQKLLPYIDKDGAILFISSAMANKPHAVSLPYGVSKAAVNALTQNLVKTCKSIRVNCVCPGFVNTQWQVEKPEWLYNKIANKIALNRFAEPDEIAEVCINIIRNTYINGAVLNVDGGYDME